MALTYVVQRLTHATEFCRNATGNLVAKEVDKAISGSSKRQRLLYQVNTGTTTVK